MALYTDVSARPGQPITWLPRPARGPGLSGKACRCRQTAFREAVVPCKQVGLLAAVAVGVGEGHTAGGNASDRDAHG